MLPLRSIAFLMYFFGLSASSLVIPVLGVANYMLIYQIFPEHAWWHHALVPLGIRYSMTAAVCMMFGMVLTVHRIAPVRPILSLWDLAALGMVLVVLLSNITGLGDSPASAPLVDKFVKMIIFVFCMTRIMTTRRNFTIIMWSLVLGSIYIGYDAWTAPRGAFARGRLDQVGGPDFRHASGLAAHMSMMLPLIAVTFMVCRSWLLRIVPFLSGALTVNTIVLCRTRSAFVGLACGAAVALILAPKRRRKRTYVAMVVAIVCGYQLADPLYWDRMSTLRSREVIEQDTAAMFRLQIWNDAREIIKDHPWGIGIGNFVPTIAQVNPKLGPRAAHNTFILCWAELGTQGIILFVTLLGISLFQTWQCHRRANQTLDPAWTRYMAYGLFVSLIICIGTQMFTERLYTEAFWWILALPSCLKRVVISEVACKEVQLGEATGHTSWGNVESWVENNPLLSDGHARGAFA